MQSTIFKNSDSFPYDLGIGSSIMIRRYLSQEPLIANKEPSERCYAEVVEEIHMLFNGPSGVFPPLGLNQAVEETPSLQTFM